MAINTRFSAPKGVQELNETSATAIGAIRNANRNERNTHNDLADAASGLAKTSMLGAKAYTSLVADKDSIEANKAKGYWQSIYESPGFKDASDTDKANMIENTREAYIGESKAFQSAFIEYSSSSYARAATGRGEEEDNTYYNAAGAAKAAWLDKETDNWVQGMGVGEGYYATNKDIHGEDANKTFVDKYQEAHPRLSKVVIGRSLLGDAYSQAISDIDAAPATKKGLEEAMANVADIKKEYQDKMFLNRKDKEGQAYIKMLESGISTAITNKQKEIKNVSYDALAVNAANGYRMPPVVMDKHIDAIATNVYTAAKDKIALEKKYLERTQADAFTASNPVGERKQFLPTNPILKEERQKEVTATLFNHFNTGDMQNFVRVAENETGMTKQTGEQFITMFNKATTNEEVSVLLDKFDLIDAQPQGAGVLRQMLTDDEYTRVKEIGYALQSRPDLTPGQARDWIDGNKTKINKLGLPPLKQRKLFEYAVKLGPQYDAYMSHMKHVMAGNPDIGEKEMKEAALHFSKMNQVDSTGKKTNIAMGTNPADDPSVMNKKDVDTKINKSLGDTVTNKTFLSNGIVIGKDEYGGTMKIINTNDKVDVEGNTTVPGLVTQSNDEEAERLKLEKDIANFQRKGGMGAVQGFWESGKLAFKNVFRDTIDNFTEIPKGLAKSGGTLVDTFQQHLYDSMTTGQKDWWDKLTAEDTSGLIAAEIDHKLNELDTEKGLEGVQNVTLSDSDLLVFENGVWQNKVDSVVIKEIQEVIVGVPTDVLEHLEVREGSRNKTYKDSLGKLTAGVGHLLSKEEQKKYPLGTKIPASVVKGWIRKDSKKAYTSAGEQAKELKVTSPEFVNALTSVNFQLGTSWYKKFPKAYQALKDKRYDDAIREVETSLWAKQTPVRVKDFKEAINKLR